MTMTMPEQIARLGKHWDEAITACRVPLSPQTRNAFDGVIRAYSEPQRFYHNLKHLDHFLYCLLDIRGWLKQPEAVQLAAFYHDAVYDSRRPDNEEQSAALARTTLSELGVNAVCVERVAELILLTKGHRAAPGDDDARWFLDGDLEVLGFDWPTYARYAAAIRQEYAWVPDAEFYPKRRSVLQGFLDRPSIYQTEWFQRSLEPQARANLQREIADIEERLRTQPS
jgi:predicted metal-dependent HD superfamily phosphohydrolase